MSELSNVRVLEVDHRATQAAKRARIAELPPAIANVELVQVDFERDALGAVLKRAGHEVTRVTCWIWEGVVMYLTRDTMRATLGDIAARSAPGSTLIVNYHTERRRGIMRWVLRYLGEPDKSALTPQEMQADLDAEGFRVEEDWAIVEWGYAIRDRTGADARGTHHAHRRRAPHVASRLRYFGKIAGNTSRS